MSLKVSSRCIALFVVIFSVVITTMPINGVSARGGTDIKPANTLGGGIYNVNGGTAAITNSTMSWARNQSATDQVNHTRLNIGGGYTSGAAQSEPPEDYDFGDAPDPTYPTLLASNGARHITGGALHLGASVDSEPDGQPNADATGDGSDDDGVTFTTLLLAGETATVGVTASAAGLLSAWIDFNGDGDWDDAGEQIFTDQTLSSGVNNLNFTVPASATIGTTFARFRLDSGGGLAPAGFAMDGEVEDYQVAISATGLTASKTAVLQVDPDGDTLPSAGDTLRYIVVLNNTSAQTVSGVTFSDTPDANTAPVIGNVTSSQGTITSGNTSGDTTIAVDIGAIASGGSVTVTFDVTINDPLPDGVAQVSNQGLVAGSDFADVNTDDPNTPASNDATVTTLNFPAPSPAPDSSENSGRAGACPNDILTALNFGADALPNGGGIACHETPADRDFLLPVPPDGYSYAYQPRHDGYFDVFGIDQNGGSFSTTWAPVEICFAPAPGLTTAQVIARYGGYPVVSWGILPTYERVIGNSIQLCATTQPNTESLSHAYTLLTGAGLEPPAVASVNLSSVPGTTTCDVTVNFRMNLRAEPGEQAAILALVPYNVTLTANMQANGWYRVDYLGTTGWLSAGFVTADASCSGLPIR